MADRYIIRVANTDLDGKKQIAIALCRIKGVSHMLARALCTIAGIEPAKKAGALTEAEEAQLNELVRAPGKAGVPEWMLNRRKDPETGEDMHLIGPDVKYVRENDVKFQRKLRTYRGQRLALNLTVRGQRTKSHFRLNRKKQVSRKARGA
jgi:small subunit ribosomal protein S13